MNQKFLYGPTRVYVQYPELLEIIYGVFQNGQKGCWFMTDKIIKRENQETERPLDKNFSGDNRKSRKSRKSEEEINALRQETIDGNREEEICFVKSHLSDKDMAIWDTATSKGKINSKKKVLGDITYGEVEEAIWHSNGLITRVSAQLNLSVVHVKRIFQKYSTLGRLFEEFREAILDEVETHLMTRIREKNDVTAMIFLLKCLGKNRGWIDNNNVSSKGKAPVKMKIVPAKKKEVKEGNVLRFTKKAFPED